MSNCRLFIVLVAVAIGIACSWVFPAVAPPQKVKAGSRWEYKILTLEGNREKTEEALNKLGAEGYRVTSISSTSGSNVGWGLNSITTIVMERPLPE